MALKIVRRYDANGNVIEDKDLERFKLIPGSSSDLISDE